MGGELNVSSEPGRGSIFSFTSRLGIIRDGVEQRLDESLDIVEGARVASGIVPSSARILVADDNPTNQLVARRMLNKLGYHYLDTATDGEMALEAVKTDKFDLILMDCQMPKLDGYDTTRAIRSLDGGDEIPVIAMTAHAMTGDREKCLDAGMNDYISKSISLESLAKLIGRHLDQS